MGQNSSIEWTEATWNPTTGCSIVSPGCSKCYAMRMAARLEAMNQPRYAGTTKKVNGLPVWTGKLNLIEDALDAPLKWRKPRVIFVNSMSDLFHEAVPFDFIDKVFAVMALCPQHTFQVLTKRPARMAEYLNERWQEGTVAYEGETHKVGPRNREEWVKDEAIQMLNGDIGEEDRFWTAEGMAISTAAAWPLRNVWLGTSVEDQQRADERIPHLLQCPAAIRFLSAEPLLGPLNLDAYLGNLPEDDDGAPYPGKVDWTIVGGESGPGARACDIEWVRAIVEQCRGESVACFVKQLGSKPVVWDIGAGDEFCPDAPGYVQLGYRGQSLKDSKGGDPYEWPEDLRVREFPSSRMEVPA